jgi:hypothetical protein
LVQLSLNAQDAVIGTDMIALNRTEAAVSASAPTNEAVKGAMILAGGYVQGGYDSNASAAVDLLRPPGRLSALPALNHARVNASAFWLPDGSAVVVGGTGELQLHNQENKSSLPMERLLIGSNGGLGAGSWQQSSEIFARDTVFAQQVDGKILALTPEGGIERISVGTKLSVDGKLLLIREALPRIRSHRSNAIMKGLADGRIIVAGGSTQHDLIAVESEGNESAIDHYTGFGAEVPAQNYDIFDPKIGQWQRSAASQLPPQGGGENRNTAILDDGRVVRIGEVKQPPLSASGTNRHDNPADDDSAQKSVGFWEISTTDGGSWQRFVSPPGDILPSRSDTYIVVAQGELFVAGPNDVQQRIVNWYDPAAMRWNRLWQGDEGWVARNGKFILRDLPKSKRVMLPLF